MIRILLFQVFMFLAVIVIQAQTVRNVNFTINGNDVNITYDLLDTNKSAQYNIELYYSLDKGINWQGPLKNDLSGDIGDNIVAGINKKIKWEPLLSMPWFFSNYVMFKISIPSFVNYTEHIAGVDLEMIAVKGASFTMGCTSEQGNDCNECEKPAHIVTLSDFHIGKYEVTQAQWQAIMGNNPSASDRGIGNDYPVNNVNWNDIQTFLTKLNQITGKHYTLPTEAEWEFAARGGNNSTGFKYSGSNDINSVAWYIENHSNKIQPVGQKLPNELGIYDMSGNVWEWCSDWYDAYPTNPIKATSGSRRVLRGGSWRSHARNCRISNRGNSHPADRNFNNGFRLALIQ